MTGAAPGTLQLVVPCFNEAGRLLPEAFLDFLAAQAHASVLFVDDGSRDATAGILAETAARLPDRVSVLTLADNGGKASAVHRGVSAAFERMPQYVGYWDADLSTPLNAAAEFVALLDSRPEVEIVMGARVKLLGRNIHRDARRHYSGRVFATAASLRLGLPVYDTQCGAKIFRVNDAVRGVFSKPFRTRWVFDVELLARYVAAVGAARAAKAIVEVPLESWSDVPGSKLTLGHALRAAVDLIRLER